MEFWSLGVLRNGSRIRWQNQWSCTPSEGFRLGRGTCPRLSFAMDGNKGAGTSPSSQPVNLLELAVCSTAPKSNRDVKTPIQANFEVCVTQDAILCHRNSYTRSHLADIDARSIASSTR